jgi:trans-2,3-dihydro-3-hydroxyanthranilate isomerase
MDLPFRLVDVFADHPLAGNQLCVLPDAAGLSTNLMQAVAIEIGFSETTFVSRASGTDYEMRIFTPGGELPFAGHPTLGTAFVLASEGRIMSPAIQHVEAGDFPVVVDVARNFAQVRQHHPTFGPELRDVGGLAEALGISRRDLHPDLPAQLVSTGLPHLMVPVASVSAVEHAEPDFRALSHLKEEVDSDAFYVFALTPGGAKARMFDAPSGIFEDPATGSAAGPLGAYLAARGTGGMPGSIVVRQGEEIGRPSTLHVTAEPEGETWAITVGGSVFVIGEGTFHLP